MNNMDASLLIADLKRQPESFFDEGRAYDLLQEYFEGFSVSSLEELLTHRNLSVRKSAIWIVSELGSNAIVVAPQVLPLLNDGERYIKYYALESLMVFSASGLGGIFHHVVSALEDSDAVIRELGMYLISNASNTQLKEAIRHYLDIADKSHVEGLRSLRGPASSTRQNLIDGVLCGENKTLAMYGAIFIKREMQCHGRKISFDSDLIDDTAIINFLSEYVGSPISR